VGKTHFNPGNSRQWISRETGANQSVKIYKHYEIRSDKREGVLNGPETGILLLVSKNTGFTTQNLPCTLSYNTVIRGEKDPPQINVFLKWHSSLPPY